MSIQKINRKARPFLVRLKNSDGETISATFATRSEAEAFVLNNKSEEKMPVALQINATERADFARIKELCATARISLQDAIPIFRDALKNFKREPLYIEDAITKFLNFAELKNVRPSTLKSYDSHTKRFLKWCNLLSYEKVATFTKDLAQEYINDVRSKEHAKTVLHVLWAFLLDNGFVAENIFHGVKIPKVLKDNPPIPILSVAATRANLNAIRPEFKPLYALMTFAGIRPEELIFDPNSKYIKKNILEFQDIDFDRRQIVVRAATSKTRHMRIISNLPSNIWAWLEPIKKWKAVYPREIEMLRQAGTRTTTTNAYLQWRKAKDKLPFKVPQDALRHSFATYAYHKIGIEHAVEVMGHVGGYAVFAKHYKGLATPDEAEQYFSILPQK